MNRLNSSRSLLDYETVFEISKMVYEFVNVYFFFKFYPITRYNWPVVQVFIDSRKRSNTTRLKSFSFVYSVLTLHLALIDRPFTRNDETVLFLFSLSLSELPRKRTIFQFNPFARIRTRVLSLLLCSF